MEQLQGTPSVMGWNNSRGGSPGVATPGESFCPGMERLQGLILSWDGTTPGESFCPGIERLQGSHSVLVKRL